ncbi:MAG TPA: PEGA domain-containing protein [Kofleriaceae bacterium]|nr:PEGA domain-containing protein [Kofleriaceae bacterium]
MKPLAIIAILACATAARAEPEAAPAPDAKRKVAVLEYRAGSSALPGIAGRVVDALTRQTSLAVLAPNQARAVYGDRLDQVLVKCAGEAGCIAKIGQKLGAAEVLLVGISELGDVILTMQRIDVAHHEVVGRIADSLAAGNVPSDDQLAGYTTRLLPPSDFLRFGVVDVVANLDGAAVTVGGAARGITPIAALRLQAPASYDIRVEKPGYLPFLTRVALPPDGELKVYAELARRGAGAAWYQHWYVLAAASAIVVGAGGAAIYFGTRDTGGGMAPPGPLPINGQVH